MKGLSAFDFLLNQYEQSKGFINFRFFCEKDTSMSKLMNSIERAWREINTLYPNIPILVDDGNLLNKTIYPFCVNEANQLNVYDTYIKKVFRTGNTIHGGGPVSLASEELPNDFLTMVYNEQFVFRLTVFYYEGIDSGEFPVGNIITNLLENADVGGVSLLSAELNENHVNSFPYSVNDLVPSFRGNSSLPIKGEHFEASSSDYPYSLTGFPCETDNKGIVIQATANCVTIDESAQLSVDENIGFIIGSQKTKFISRVWSSDEVKDITIFGVPGEDRIYPVWEIEHGFFVRSLIVPKVDTVDEAFRISKKYPTTPALGEVLGCGLQTILFYSSIPVVSDLIGDGVVIEEYVDENDEICFILFLETENAPCIIQLGNEERAKKYFNHLSRMTEYSDSLDLLSTEFEFDSDLEPTQPKKLTLN